MSTLTLGTYKVVCVQTGRPLMESKMVLQPDNFYKRKRSMMTFYNKEGAELFAYRLNLLHTDRVYVAKPVKEAA